MPRPRPPRRIAGRAGSWRWHVVVLVVVAVAHRIWVTIRRLLRAGLTVPLLSGGLLLVTAGPAVACSCPIAKSEAERVARADAVFVGTLASQSPRSTTRPANS